jgi:hypothetical protein
MEFWGPASADYADVRSLNRTFLCILRASGPGAAQRRKLPENVGPQVVGLTDLQIERLSGCPFLLMSFRERDADYWRSLLADQPTGDLWAEAPGDAAERIVTAGLAFLWQLARRNPYAVRLIAGASVAWCEQLAAAELIDLLQRAASRGDLLSPRFAGQADPWSRLLGPGLGSRPAIRTAAHLSVLQSMLTGATATGQRRLRAAACAYPVPTLGFSDRSDGR